MSFHKDDGESDLTRKLEQHLSLLREEYVGLQARYAEMERRYQMLQATCGDAKTAPDNFIARLVKIVGELFESELYSDLTVHLDGHQVRAHKLVFAAHSEHWCVPDLASLDSLDFNGMSYNIGYIMLQWMYRDHLDPKLGDNILIEVMKAAKRFELQRLLQRCEQVLISRLDVPNCIKFYQHADLLGAGTLKDQCSQLISKRWDDFNADHFVDMPANLLYKMLRARNKFPLHSAVHLKREDVVFLYLVEYDAEVATRSNAVNEQGELALGLALWSGQLGVAQTLLKHKANVSAEQGNGVSLLIRAIKSKRDDLAKFLLDNGANASAIDPESKLSALQLIADMDPTACVNPISLDGFADVVDLLISKNCDLAYKSPREETALHICLQRGNMPVCTRLVAKASPELLNVRNASDLSPLWYALQSTTDFAAASKLVERGADANYVQKESGNSLLQMCIVQGNQAAALFLLSQSVDVGHVNKKGETALHLACSNGLVDACRRLLESGADPNAQTSAFAQPGSQTPLHIAIAASQHDVVELFLQQHASGKIALDFTLVDANGETVLGQALWSNYLDVAKVLIAGGINVNARNNSGFTLLHQALLTGNGDAAMFLLENGASATEKTNATEAPLLLAINAQLTSVVRLLCRQGANVNQVDNKGDPALWLALQTGQEDIASVLVAHGCDTNLWVDGPSNCRQTLLHRAIDENNEYAACFLVRSLCDLSAVRKPGLNGEGGEEAHDKQTPLHMAVIWGLENVVRTAIEHGANVNAQDVEGRTPVHHAVINQHQEILAILLSAADVRLTQRDRRGATAFSTAMSMKNNKAASLILQKDAMAAYQVDGKGFNYLHTAVKQQDLEAVLFLLSIHMDVNVPVSQSPQVLPIHLAAQGGDELIMRNLLLAGANVHALTPNKQTALHLAAAADKPAICSILLENGVDPQALDDGLNNAVHLAVQAGSLSCVRVLLTESRINAEAVNMRGQSPLHLLGTAGKENAAAIFDLFLDTVPNYPIDKPDAEGNTVLLLAYMNGNAQLCKAYVRAGGCIGGANFHGISIFNYQVATKQLLHKLLDQLSKEPKWAEGENCSECGVKFTITVRKHHCRHCGRLLCAKCSESQMPILKYDLRKPVRVCNVCYDVLTLGAAQ